MFDAILNCVHPVVILSSLDRSNSAATRQQMFEDCTCSEFYALGDIVGKERREMSSDMTAEENPDEKGGVVDQYISRGLCSAEQIAALQVAQAKLAEENAATVLALADKILACAL
ncbi:MAG: hypothetical protein Q9187_002334 [Circinaria calcarea]